MPVQQPVQYGRDVAHISWAAWVFRSLEDYMNERQHHLNESSSARLGRSQQLEILPSPNSKQTQCLGADFSDGRIALAHMFLISAEILTSALFLSYIMWRSNFTIPHSSGAYILSICLYFGHPPIFWKSAYILEKCLYFEQAPIFFVCADILGKRQYYDFALLFCLILLLQIFVYIFSIYLCIFMCASIFGAIVLRPRFKIDVVIMIIWGIVIIINSVLTLQVSTASLPHR